MCEGLERALVLYDSALALDANMVDALLGKSATYSALFNGFEHPSAVMPKAAALIERAIAISHTRRYPRFGRKPVCRMVVRLATS